MAEWLMAADCKSAALTCYGGSNPSLPTSLFEVGGQRLPLAFDLGKPAAGFPEPFRAYQGEGTTKAQVAQLVEHVLGKDGVSSSNLLLGSMNKLGPKAFVGTRGSNSGVESQPSKLLVAGSNPVSRSIEGSRLAAGPFSFCASGTGTRDEYRTRS